MPFGSTNVITTNAGSKGIINSFTAGEDRIVACTTQYQLEGYVDGDLTGHSIEWEQIDGVSVTNWNPSRNVLNPIVTFDSLADNMVFRLYIDRNTPNEMFDDVVIYKSPTTFSTIAIGINDLISPISAEETPKFENSVSTGYAIRWTPNLISLNPEYIGVAIEKWDTNTNDWVTVQTFIKPNDTGFYEMTDIGAPYRLNTMWKKTNGQIYFKPLNKYFVNSATTRQPVDISGIANSTITGHHIIQYGDQNVIRQKSVKKTYTVNSTAELSNEMASYNYAVNRYNGRRESFIGPNSTLGLSDTHRLYKYKVTRSNGITIG